MDTRQRNIAGEIARLEAPAHGERQALRRNLAVAHEELGALYRRLHALGAASTRGADIPLYVVDVAALDDNSGGA